MPDIKDSLVNSLIGAGSAVDGDLDIEGMLRVDGDLRGSVRATGKVVVGASGRVEASIRARSAIIGGLVKGDVYVTEQLRILSGGVVVGNVFAPRLEAEDGTLVHGDLAVTGRPDRAEDELKAFVERYGDAARFLCRFRSSDFAAQAARAAGGRDSRRTAAAVSGGESGGPGQA
ncbi:MAG TPA: polymer-forming cytoskeletal protein [Spirochaetia bacterium]|nr:polymer-forming cytoskeletal protein [Spirochaetales bacterium]HRY72535.1 polymer-forming cytoskeletal protein [Spirochaetia bacterium]